MQYTRKLKVYSFYEVSSIQLTESVNKFLESRNEEDIKRITFISNNGFYACFIILSMYSNQ